MIVGPHINQDSVIEVEPLGLIWNKALVTEIWPYVINCGNWLKRWWKAAAFAGPEVSMAESREEKMDVKRGWQGQTGTCEEDGLDPALASEFPIPMMQVSGRRSWGPNMHLTQELEKLKEYVPGRAAACQWGQPADSQLICRRCKSTWSNVNLPSLNMAAASWLLSSLTQSSLVAKLAQNHEGKEFWEK